MAENLMAVSAIVGALLPLAISLVKRAHWSNQQKKIAAVVISGVAAVVTTLAVEGSISFDTLVASAGTIFALAKTTYDGFWEDTSVDATLTRVLS